MFTAKQVHELADICRQASEVEILPRFRALDPDHIDTKSGFDDLVTVADQASERFIFERLIELYPNALLIGEESVYENPQVLNQYQDAELAFVLDPIDGTWHFANGSTAFGILLGVASHGEMLAGIIYEPVTGDYQWAVKGEGAYERANGTDVRLTVGRHADRSLEDTICSFSFGVFRGEARTRALKAIEKMGRIMDYRCSAMEYRLFNSAATAFAIHRGVLNLWDHGSNILLAKEAGAVVRMLDGSDYEPQVNGIMIVAESEARWKEVAGLFE